MILNFILLICSFSFMEFVAWSNHKYIMHGFLWKWHKDHHVNDAKKQALHDMKFSGFEKNDYFFLLYATPAIVLIIMGLYFNFLSLIFVGAGITLYGFVYFLIHDVLIHRRLKIPFLINSKNKYFKAIIKAHLAHHRPKSTNDFNNFGLLIFSSKYFADIDTQNKD